MSKIYDSFLFLNELDLLEVRLNELNDIVDYFVVCEGNKTFSNLPKEYELEKNKERFLEFWHKIIYIKADLNHLPGQNPWRKEDYQRNLLTKIDNISGDDIFVISDLDEIPTKEQLELAIQISDKESRAVSLYLELYFYYLNNKCLNVPFWIGPVVCKRSLFKNPQTLRTNRATYSFGFTEKMGWHFSYCSLVEDTMHKIRSYSHFEEYMHMTEEKLKEYISTGRSFINTDNKVFKKDSSHLPKHILKNKQKFKHLLLHEEKKVFFRNKIIL